jgi:hypothetical protein
MEIIREDPPAQRRTVGKYDEVADQLAGDPGNWYRIATRAATGALAAAINKGAARSFQPPGSFEAVSRTQDDGVSIWARYVGQSGPRNENA